MRIFYFYLCAVLSLLTGCSYELEELQNTPIEINDTQPILLNPDQTNIELIEPIWFLPNIEFNPKTQLKGVELVIDNQIIEEGNNLFTFYLHPKDYSNGSHELKIITYTTTGTGSLADKIGAEFQKTVYNWNFTVDKVPPAKLSLDAEIIDGQLKIKWGSPEKFNFSYYEIRKGKGDQYLSYTIDDINQTEIIDESYVGGEVWYSIHIISELFEVSSDRIYVDYDGFAWWDAEVINGNVQFSWSSPIFFQNVNAIQVTSPHYARIIDIDQNSFEFDIRNDLIVGDSSEVQLNLYGKASPLKLGEEIFVKSKSIIQGEKLMEIERLLYNKEIGSYYVLSHYNQDNELYSSKMFLHRVDNSFEIVSTYQLQNIDDIPRVSQNGNYFYILSESDLIALDPLTLTTIGTYDLNQFLFDIPAGGNYHNFSITNDNNVCVNYAPTSYDNFSLLIDMETIQLINSREVRIAKVSEDKRFFVEKASNHASVKLYEIIGSDSVLLKDFYSDYWFDDYFFIENQNTLMLIDRDDIVFWDLNNNTEISKFSLEILDFSNWSHSFDGSNELVYINTRVKHYLLNYKTGEIVKEISKPYDWPELFYSVANGFVFSNTGYYEPILHW